MESYDSTFFEDEGGYDDNNNDTEVQEDDVNSSSDLDDDEASPKLSAKQQAAAAAAAQQQAAAAAQQQDTGNMVFTFTLDRSDCQFGPNRTAEQKAREGTWMVVVLRDLEQLVAELRVSAAESDSNPDSIDAETGDLSHGSYAVIDGVRLAASDAMNIRLKRDCALINTAIKSDGANNYITPEAAELLTPALMPFVLSQELMCLCRSTWNTTVVTLRQVLRATRAPPSKKTTSPDGSTTPVTSPQLKHKPLHVETGPNIDWRPIHLLSRKLAAAYMIPGHSQAFSLVAGLSYAACKMMPSSALREIWESARRHYVGFVASAFMARVFPTRLLARNGGAADTDSIREQCAVLREMVDTLHAMSDAQVPYPLVNDIEEIVRGVSLIVFAPVGQRLIERNREAFDAHVVPLRNHCRNLFTDGNLGAVLEGKVAAPSEGPDAAVRVGLSLRKSSSAAAHDVSTKLLALLIVRNEPCGWNELVRWRRVMENAFTTKAHSAAPVRYLCDLIFHVSQFTQRRIALLRATHRPMPAGRDALDETCPALEGEALQRFLGLTVPLVAQLAFNPSMFGQFSHAAWILVFLDPTPATAARLMASVEVGMSESGAETRQVTQALKILNEQLCAMTAESAFRLANGVASAGGGASNVDGLESMRPWPELKCGNVSADGAKPPTYTTAGDLQAATLGIAEGCVSPFDVARKVCTAGRFFRKALDNFVESTIEDRVDDALRCVYTIAVFGQCDAMPLDERVGMLAAFMDKCKQKYEPVQSNLSAGTAGILHYAFAALLRLVSDDAAETQRVVTTVADMVGLPAMHEVWTTFTRTMVAAILEAGATHLMVAAQRKESSAASPTVPKIEEDGAAAVAAATTGFVPCSNVDIEDHREIVNKFFVPFVQKIFAVTHKELENGLSTPSRFVGNIYLVCTLLEHLPACVMRQLALQPLRAFALALVKWCQQQASDPQLDDKSEANIRCAASSIQTVLDVGMRALCRSMPLHPAQVTVGAKVWISERARTHFLPTTLADQRAARETIIEFMALAAGILRADVRPDAKMQERALQCCVAGRIIGGTRFGCWFFSRSLKDGRDALDQEIVKARASQSLLSGSDGSNSAPPSLTSEWWNARIYEVEGPLDAALMAPVPSVTDPTVMRDLTDLDTEIYVWLIQELLRDHFAPVLEYKAEAGSTEAALPAAAGADDAMMRQITADAAVAAAAHNKEKPVENNAWNKNEHFTPANTLSLTHPVCSVAPGVGVDDVPLAALKTIISLLESNYTFDYSGLLNGICAPGDDAGKILYHVRVGSARLTLRARNRCGAFPRNSSRWSSEFEAAVMFNLAFSKSLVLRQQAQAVLVSFCSMWCNCGSYPELVRGVVNGLRARLGMERPGWLARLTTVDCKAALHLIPDLISVIGRDDAFALADPLLTELALGGELPRPSNEQRKEGKIAFIISKLNSTTCGPPAAVCDQQVGRWLTLATNPNHAPLCVNRCLSVALCYFRTNIRIDTACSVNMVSRQASLAHVTPDHVQFLLSLVSRLHRATTNAWKVLHMIGLVAARTMHFVHTHLPAASVVGAAATSDAERTALEQRHVLPVVRFHAEQMRRGAKSKIGLGLNNGGKWQERPVHAQGWERTFGCALYDNHLQPSASCSECYRANNTWGLLWDPHTSLLATTLGKAFLSPELVRSCLDVHVSLLRSEAIAGDRNSRGQGSNPADSALAHAIDWSRFARCAMWAQIGARISSDSIDARESAALEMKAMREIVQLWVDMADKILPSFETAQTDGRSPARSPAMGAIVAPRSPAVGGLPAAIVLDAGPAIGSPSSNAATPAAALPSFGVNTAAVAAAAAAAAAASQADAAKKHADPAAPSNKKAASAADKDPDPHASKQTTATCEFLAAAALLRGMHTMLMHLAFPAVPIESDREIAQARADCINDIVGLFRAALFGPAVPQEAAELLLGPWNDFMGALADSEKEPIVRYLIGVVTMSRRTPEAINESVRRRAWSALARCHLSPSTSIWRDTFVVRSASLLHRIIVSGANAARKKNADGAASFPSAEERDDILRPSIDDQSRSVRQAANAVLREFCKNCNQLRVSAGYDESVGGAIARDFPVSAALRESDRLADEVKTMVLDRRFAEVDTEGDGEKAKTTRLRAALALIQLAQSSCDIYRIIRKIPDIAQVIINVPSEAASSGQLTGLRHPPFDRLSGILTGRVVHDTLRAELRRVKAAADRGEPMSVAIVAARLLPMCILMGWLAQGKYSCDMAADLALQAQKERERIAAAAGGEEPDAFALWESPLDAVAAIFALPGRAVLESAMRACAVWVTALPRNDVRAFVVRHIKAVDAAAAVKDTLTMKVAVAALSAVVNSFPEHVPAFVPAAVMKLVRYRNTTQMSRADEVEQKIAELEKEVGTVTREQINAIIFPGGADDSGEDSASSAPSSPAGSPATGAGGATGTAEDYKSIATDGLQKWWASHLEAWEQAHKACFTESQCQAINDACKARSYFV